MHLDEEEARAELGVAHGHAQQQVQRKDGHGNGAEERKPRVEPEKVVVEEAVHRRLQQHEEDLAGGGGEAVGGGGGGRVAAGGARPAAHAQSG